MMSAMLFSLFATFRHSFSKAHTRPPTVFIDEFDPSSLQNSFNRRKRRRVANVPPSFDICDGIAMKMSCFRKVPDRPI
jgi:hypothetical protein